MDKLQIKCDDLESYSRRYCLRLNGIPVHHDEKNEDCLKTLEKCYKEINLPFVSDEIDRVHRIGKSMIEKGSGKKVRQMIVKFKSWNSRKKLYFARPKFQKDKKKPGNRPFTITIDLTKRHYEL